MKTRLEMKRALQANPLRRMSTLQRMWELILTGMPIDPATLNREELAAIFTARSWVAGILDPLPDLEDLHNALRKRDLLAPMERLSGGTFVGRTRELAQLAQFVSGNKQVAPLFVFGIPGGVGKSTLLARFVLSYAVRNSLPVAYLDLDKPTIRADVPLTLTP